MRLKNDTKRAGLSPGRFKDGAGAGLRVDCEWSIAADMAAAPVHWGFGAKAVASEIVAGRALRQK